MEEAGKGAVVCGPGLMWDDTAALVFMLLAPSQLLRNRVCTQVPKSSWLISQQLASYILIHQSVREGPPKLLETMRV